MKKPWYLWMSILMMATAFISLDMWVFNVTLLFSALFYYVWCRDNGYVRPFMKIWNEAKARTEAKKKVKMTESRRQELLNLERDQMFRNDYKLWKDWK